MGLHPGEAPVSTSNFTYPEILKLHGVSPDCCFTKDRSGCSGARGRTGGALSGRRSLSEITNKSRSPHRDEKSAVFGGLVGASDGGNYAALKPVFNSQQTDLLTRVIRK